MKILSLFSGIGAVERAFENLNIDFELVNYCEKDSVISKCYSILHNVPEELNLGDITLVNKTKIDDFDFMSFTFPCNSLTKYKGNTGKGLNSDDSGLYYYGLDILKYKQPKYCFIENVDNLAGKQHYDDFDRILNDLDSAGYNSYYSILNSHDFGIPQHRRRLYIVSIRKDIKQTFNFPVGNNHKKWWEYINPYETRKLTKRQLNAINKVKNNEITDLKIEGTPQFDCSVISLRKSGLRFQSNDYHPTVTAYYGTGGGNFSILAYQQHIGGITPRQCFKLMGFKYEDYDILKFNNIPDMYLYIMAGNSITVNVVEEIFKCLFV